MDTYLFTFILAAVVAAQTVGYAWMVGEFRRLTDVRWKDSQQLRDALADLEEQGARLEEAERLLDLHGIRRRLDPDPPISTVRKTCESFGE